MDVAAGVGRGVTVAGDVGVHVGVASGVAVSAESNGEGAHAVAGAAWLPIIAMIHAVAITNPARYVQLKDDLCTISIIPCPVGQKRGGIVAPPGCAVFFCLAV